MTSPSEPLSYATAPLCSLGLYSRRVTQSLVGRGLELTAVEREVAAARNGMACLSMEGEPGIGKTRVLLSVEEIARVRGFRTIGATADEEIRGPFLVAKSIFASPALGDLNPDSPAEEAVRRVTEALTLGDSPGLESLAPERKLLRVFDLAANALRLLAIEKPLALLIDDLQWADEDSLRMLRYVVRAIASSPILLVFASRPSETAFIHEAVTLLADLERMGLLRRIKLARFGQAESTEFLRQVLGADVNLSSAAIMHAQSEGVPFILAEQAQAYREAGLIQQVDGVWTLARNADRLLPSAVRTLIERRVARLPEATRTTLAEAAILGRSFSLRDLREIKQRLNAPEEELAGLPEAIAPAVASGLLVEHGEASAADYSFTHDQIREYATATIPQTRRRLVHKAVVDLLTGGGDPAPASLPLLAQHALAAGDAELSTRCSIEAARRALQVHAPEEALRMVEVAHSVATSPKDRVSLLTLRDDALSMLRRPGQRLEGLSELAALAEALGDEQLKMRVMLRRAAAFRISGECEQAAEIARRVRATAAASGDRETELLACIELGQDILKVEIGEGYSHAVTESDLDEASEAFEHAAALAETVDDQASFAAATRELGVITVSRLRIRFLEMYKAGEHIPIIKRLTEGQRLSDIVPTLPIAPLVAEANERLSRALEVYDRIGDRQGAMSAIIALAFVAWAPEIHLTGSTSRIEEIRRLATRLQSLTKESDRELADAQMIFGVHVYARAKVFPDVAVAKGREAFDAARTLGDRSLEFAAAGGVALSHAEMGQTEDAQTWLGRAAAIARDAPNPYRARQIEFWRGIVRALEGDASGMREHLERAVQISIEQNQTSAKCEAMARLALESARLAAGAPELLALAERSANEVTSLVGLLRGHPAWKAQALAALSMVRAQQGRQEDALTAARDALNELDSAFHDDVSLEVVLPAAAAILEFGEEQEVAMVRERLLLILTLIAQRMTDESARVDWFRGPYGRELSRLTGDVRLPASGADGSQVGLDEEEIRILQLLTEGLTNSEIAKKLGVSEAEVRQQMAALLVKIGASSRADATAFAITRTLR